MAKPIQRTAYVSILSLVLSGCFSAFDFADPPDAAVDVTMDAGSDKDPDAEIMDSHARPDAMAIDAGFADTGIDPGDSGEHPDADTSTASDASVHPDAEMLDSGMHPDAEMLDSGMHPDAEMLDSGMHPDAAAPIDSGVWAIICPDNPRTDDELYVVENSDCALSMGMSNLPPSPQTSLQWHRIRSAMISDHPDPLTTAQTQKGDQIYARVDYLAGTVPFVLTPEITIENSPPEIPNYSFQRQIPGPSFVPYSGNEFAKTDDIVKCMMDAPAVDADLDPLSYYLTLESPGTRTSSISTTTHDIAIEQTLNVMNPGANDVVSCTASVQDDALALTSTAAVRTICEKEYTTFSGTQYIQFAEHGGFGFGRYTGTIEAWVYWHGGQTQNSYIYSRWWDSNADHAFGVDSLGRLFGVLSGYYGNLIINSVTTTGHSLEPHKWTHVAMTWVANGSMYLFINGEQKGSAALQTEISGGGGPILGWPAARGANRQPLFGSIASFRISSTVRYDHNVDFTPDRNYGFDADTKIFIPLDEGSGTANVTATQTDGMGGSTTIQSITNTSSLWATERCIRR